MGANLLDYGVCIQNLLTISDWRYERVHDTRGNVELDEERRGTLRCYGEDGPNYRITRYEWSKTTTGIWRSVDA